MLKKMTGFMRGLAVAVMISAMMAGSASAATNVLTTSASGTVTYGNSKATIDASNASSGYVMVKYAGSKSKLKVQISKSGSETYTYDLNSSGNYEVFPLSEGSGAYTVKVFENVSGNQYLQDYSQTINVTLQDDHLPFLYPNQYVNFSAGSAVVSLADTLTAGVADQVTQVTNIYNYVVENFTYDTAKAQSVQTGYLPNIDAVLASKTGICFDYAAVMTAMLRSQGIPTKLIVGYTGEMYHAWISVYLKDIGWVDNIIYFDGVDWKLMDPTFDSSSGRNPEVQQYIGNAANYQGKYSY